jgi:hypothetical protein
MRSAGLVNVGTRQQEILVDLTADTIPTGTSTLWGPVLRWKDDTNYLIAGVDLSTNGVVRYRARKWIAGVATSVVSATNVPELDAAGYIYKSPDVIHIRARADRDHLQLRVWITTYSPGVAEPDYWHIDICDPDWSNSGVLGWATTAGLGRDTASGVTNSVALNYDNAGIGPYWPGSVRPGRFVRFQAEFSGGCRDLWTGTVEELYPGWGGQDETVLINAVDAFGAADAAPLEEHSPEEATGDRIRRVIGAAGLAGNCDTGDSILPSDDLDTRVLSHAQDAAASERGELFCDGLGNITFTSRHHRLLFNSLSVASFDDSQYTELTPENTIRYVRNHAEVTPGEDGAIAISDDAASQMAYRRRSIELSSLITDPQEAQDCADYLVSRYKDPGFRFGQLQFTDPDAATWQDLLQLELGSRITITRTTPHGVVYTGDQHVEGVTITCQPANIWTVILDVTPADLQQYWVLESTSLGTLDQSTRLAY